MTGFGSHNLPSPNRALTKNSNSSQCCGLPVKPSRQITSFGPRSPSHAQTLTSRMVTADPGRRPIFGNALPTAIDPLLLATAFISAVQKHPATIKVFSVASGKGATGQLKTSTPCARRMWSATGTPRSQWSSTRTALSPGSSLPETSYRSIHCSTPLVFTSLFVSWFSPFCLD